MTGYVTGRLADDEGADELLATAEKSIAVGKRLNVARLNLHGTGLGDRACRSHLRNRDRRHVDQGARYAKPHR